MTTYLKAIDQLRWALNSLGFLSLVRTFVQELSVHEIQSFGQSFE
jgi:hypothetical protein